MLTMENHFMKAQLQQIQSNAGPSLSNSSSDDIYNVPPHQSAVPPHQGPPDVSPFTAYYPPSLPTENYGAPLEQSPGVHNMSPHPPGVYDCAQIEGRELEKAASSPQLPPPPLPPPHASSSEGAEYHHYQYDVPPRFRAKHDAMTNLPSTTRETGRQYNRYTIDNRHGSNARCNPRGRSSTELNYSTFTAPGYRRNDRTPWHQSIRRTPSHGN